MPFNIVQVLSTGTSPVWVSGVVGSVEPSSSVVGAIAAQGGIVSLAIGSAKGVAFTVTGSYTGTIEFEASFDNQVSWWGVEAYSPYIHEELVYERLVNMTGVFTPYDIAGATHVRLSASSWGGGQAYVAINAGAHQARAMVYTREDGDPSPTYGVQMGGNDQGTFRFIHVDQSGSLLVTASQARPLWVTGSITSVAAATGTFVAVEASVGELGQPVPVSATYIAGYDPSGNLRALKVDDAGALYTVGGSSGSGGNVNITGSTVTLTVSQSNTPAGTASITGTVTVVQGAANTQTFNSAVPWRVTLTDQVAGNSVNIALTDFSIAQAGMQVHPAKHTGTLDPVLTDGYLQLLRVDKYGRLIIATSGANSALTVSQSNPVLAPAVTQTASWVVTGSVSVANSLTVSQSNDQRVVQTSSWTVTGTVQSTQTGSWVVTSSAGNPVGVTGTVHIDNTSLAVTQTASLVVTGTVQVTTTGTLTVSQSNVPAVQVVTSTLANPAWVAISGAINTVFSGTQVVTASSAAPVWVTGSVTVNTGSSGGGNVSQTASWVVTGSVSVANSLTVSQSNDQRVVQTASWVVTGSVSVANNLTVSQSNPVLTSSVTQTGSWTVTGSVSVSQTGTLTVSQSNDQRVVQTASWVVTGSVSVSQTGTLTVSQSNLPSVYIVTGTQENPVWVTSSGGGSSVTVTNVVTVTGTQANPVWVTQSGGGSSVSVSNTASITASLDNPVTVALSGAIAATITGVMEVTSSQTNPVWVTSSGGGGAVSQTSSWVVTGSVSVSQTGTLTVSQSNDQRVIQTGSWVVTGSVSVTTTGTLTVSQSNDQRVNQTASWVITGSVTNNNGISGTWVLPPPAATSNVTTALVSGTSVTILAANVNRYFASIQNTHPSATLFVKLGSGATSASMTVRMTANSYYEVPGRYTGLIAAIASGTNVTGSVAVTELTT